MSTVAALIASEHIRLVTITGSGGIGKTRLAMAVATRSLGRMTTARVGSNWPPWPRLNTCPEPSLPHWG